MQTFTYQAAPMRVVFGTGTLNRLADELVRLGIARALVLATPNQAQQAASIVAMLGDCAAGVFAEAEMHTPVGVTERAMAYAKNLKVDRTDQDILFELLLKLGLDLTVPMARKKMEGSAKKRHDVHSIGGGVLLVCLSESIAREDVEPLAMGIIAWHKEQAPAGDTTCVFRDSAFVDDVAKTNLAAILQQHGLQNVRSL